MTNQPIIYRCCREVGLPETEFKPTDGFVTTLRRKPERAFDAVGGKGAEQVAPAVAEQVTGEVAGEVERVLLEQRRAKTRALKQSMMQELLTGRTRRV